MLDIKEYLKQTKTVLVTQDAFDELVKRASAQPDRGCIDQIMWERDTAIQQLAELGYGFGEKIRTDGDCISRQAAIDIERNATVDTNPSHFEAHQKFTQFMDDAEISSFGRWQWSNGFNTALTAVGIDLKKLPSAHPEIIRCKDCRWWDKYNEMLGYCMAAKHGYLSEHWEISIRRTYKEDFYCADAERRTDG